MEGQDRPASPIYELRRPEASLGRALGGWGETSLGWFEGQQKETHGLNMVFNYMVFTIQRSKGWDFA